jgi:hypothetical protein
MAVIDDLEVFPELDPRLVLLGPASNSVTVQDIHDTLCAWQDSTDGHPFDVLVESAGKEALGGGVTVGITTTLQNARIGFAAHKEWKSAGTATGADPSGVILVDSGATFVADGVEPGTWIINLTDGSIATVLRVASETQLVTDTLGGGTDDQWEVGDGYRILEVLQKNIDGGNLVAVDELQVAIDPIFTTAGNQVVRTSSSSATLQELADIQYSSFLGGVTVNVLSPYSGTEYPVGTPRQPVNNLADALLISVERGFPRIFVLGDLTIGPGIDVTGIIFEGESSSKTLITIDPAAVTTRCEFSYAQITGTLDGGSLVTNCDIGILNFVDGFIESCVLNGPITLSGLDTAHFLSCYAGDPSAGTPVIDMAGSGSTLALRDYNGGIELRNKTGPEMVSIDLSSGHIILANTVTNGTVVCRGVGKLIDNALGGTTVVNELITAQSSQFVEYAGAVVIDTINGSAGTQYPRGTQRSPVNNLADAKVIAAAYGFSRFSIAGVLILSPTDNVDGLTLTGQNALVDTVVMLPGCSTVNTVFHNLRLTGTFGGGVFVEKCALSSCSNIGSDTEPSLFNECILIESTFTFAAGLVTPQKMQFVQCLSGVRSAVGVVIDYNGAAIASAFRKYSGAATLINHSGAASSLWELENGAVTLESSCTAGLVLIRGRVDIVDNSAGTSVVADGSALTAAQSHQLQSLFKAMALDPADKWITTPNEMRTASGDIIIKLTGDGQTYAEGERQWPRYGHCRVGGSMGI